MQHIKLFSERFTQLLLSADVQRQLLKLCCHYHIRKLQASDSSLDLFAFIHLYYASGAPAVTDQYRIKRILKLLELRIELWRLLIATTDKSTHALKPLFLEAMVKERKVLTTFIEYTKRNVPGTKLSKASLQLLLLKLNKTEPVTKESGKAAMIHNPKKQTATSTPPVQRTPRRRRTGGVRYPYHLLTMDDYNCRGSRRSNSPVLYTGMTA